MFPLLLCFYLFDFFISKIPLIKVWAHFWGANKAQNQLFDGGVLLIKDLFSICFLKRSFFEAVHFLRLVLKIYLPFFFFSKKSFLEYKQFSSKLFLKNCWLNFIFVNKFISLKQATFSSYDMFLKLGRSKLITITFSIFPSSNCTDYCLLLKSRSQLQQKSHSISLLIWERHYSEGVECSKLPNVVWHVHPPSPAVFFNLRSFY